MKVKLDENLGARGAQVLKDGGCDVATVVAQDLCGSSDEGLIQACGAERRVLVSLDKGFSSILPSRLSGTPESSCFACRSR